jgi:Nucleotide modification associated domain 3
MPRAVAINVGANTSLPGFRGPIYPDGRFEYVPIPEREPVREPVPTYADLELPIEVPDSLLDRRVHLDPSFAEYPRCEAYTYGDEHAVKAGPLSELEAGDVVLFYATLSTVGEDPAPWITPDWGAYVIGSFVLAAEPVSGEEYLALSEAERAPFASNAHCKRAVFDAEVLLVGEPERSGLRDRALALSGGRGSEPNRIVTDLSSDSGRGPWWRRPLRFDADATDRLLSLSPADLCP